MLHRLPAGTTLDAITNANRNSGGANSNLPSPASLQAQIDATAKLKITAPSIFLTPTTTVRVLVWNDDAFSLSAGHVLVTDTGGNVILSQFPSGGVATAVSDQHDNTTFSPEQTFRAENRPPDIVLVITVPNARGFFSAAVDHRTRADWSWNPSGCDETNCSWAAYGALRAGGVDLPVYTDDMLPRTLGTDLLNAAQNNSNIQVVDQPRPPRG